MKSVLFSMVWPKRLSTASLRAIICGESVFIAIVGYKCNALWLKQRVLVLNISYKGSKYLRLYGIFAFIRSKKVQGQTVAPKFFFVEFSAASRQILYFITIFASSEVPV